jgi:hypothetical protein
MNREKVGKILTARALWGAALALCFGLGTQTARPDVPNCIVCPCKVVTFWQDADALKQGAFQLGAAPATSDTAVPFIYTFGNCAPTPNSNNGTMDKWRIPWWSLSCANPGTGPIELSVTPQQIGTVPGTQQAGVNRLKCAGPNGGGQ